MPLSDLKLRELAVKADEVDQHIKELKKRKEKLQSRIIRELDRRGTRMIEINGVKITRVSNPITTYDWRALVRTIGKERARRIQAKQPDKAALAREVQAGRIAAEDVAACSSTAYSKPWVNVTFVRRR